MKVKIIRDFSCRVQPTINHVVSIQTFIGIYRDAFHYIYLFHAWIRTTPNMVSHEKYLVHDFSELNIDNI